MSAATKDGWVAGDRLAGMDLAAHNAEVKATWAALDAGRPTRTPIVVGTNTRYFLFNQAANAAGPDFRQYSEDPEVMFDTQLRLARWGRFNLLQDAELGMPEAWSVTPDFQNYYEAGWFGCPVEYFAGQVPDTQPAFAADPEKVMEKGLPDPFGGLGGKALAYYERYKERAEKETYLGRPIRAGTPMQGTDGPLTVACNLFGPEFVCEAMAAEPERLHRLLDFITEATIARMKAWRKLAGTPVPQEMFWYADDSVALISTEMLREHVLPYHRRLCEAFGVGKRCVHLCGDSTRHLRLLRDELNIWNFDTGFPVDFGKLRRELGPKVAVSGGPHVDFLRTAQPAEVRREVKRILGSGVLEGGLFVLREGNNLAPYTPLENIEAMYHAGREFGKIG